MELALRRVVTGHDSDGKSTIVRDGQPVNVRRTGTDQQRVSFEVWNTTSVSSEGQSPSLSSSEIRIVNIPPGSLREMHRTDTVDYGIMLAGELYLILEKEETLLRAGDVVVQRGTYHAWHNRSDAYARIAFINLKGQYSDLLD